MGRGARVVARNAARMTATLCAYAVRLRYALALLGVG